MDEFIKMFGVFAGMGMAGASVYAVIAFVNVTVKRLERGKAGATPELEAEVADLRARLDESDALRGRVAELEERLDFAERLLTQQREAERLGPGAP